MAQQRIDFEKLKLMKSPLLTVWEAMNMGSTYRDDPQGFLEDVKIALQARDPKTMLSKAIDDLEARTQIKKDIEHLSDQLDQAIETKKSNRKRSK